MQTSIRTEDHDLFRKSLRKMLEKEAFPFYQDWERAREIPSDFWLKLGENGYLCPWIAEEDGGLGLDFSFSKILIEELERVGQGVSSSVSLHSEIASPYLAALGTDEQKQRWLPGCLSGEKITAIAMTEPGTGSDLAGIKTSARLEGDHYIVNGEKTFITNGNRADLAIVVCRTDQKPAKPHQGISLLVVEDGTKGFKKGKNLEKIGMHSGDTGELIFEDAVVPVGNLLGEEGKGFYYLMQQLQQERLVVAIQCQIEAEEMLRLTIDYVKQRQAFGQSISKFQNTQFKIAEMATEIELGKTFVNQLTLRHVHGENIVKEVSMAKYWISEMAKRVASECLQLHGGYGFMEEYEIARRFRDIQVTSLYAGTSEIMKTIIAKQLDL
ncbi:acyl-CoA dehydrogenase family protein [Bacillus sp. B15-48]|uniref:acyl-CoA dehydrogenase family protein n=1 Tax=Bacillus sp. B15-48 TaxID=1548601 RepID=UPI00193EC39C|nr:acyl-CoA dehydrogenase family protein [Bacillus sp. B15-48]MBM4761809.1 acyl-CoA dehydrogenase [Bacillus sp. B15-48]